MFDEMIFGAQYYRPPFPTRDVWHRDLKNMREYGFNTVKIWAVWNWVEKQRGIFDFEELDTLVTIADHYGLKTIVNIIPEGAPYWAYGENQEALYRTSRGEAVTVGGPANLPSAGWPGFCWDNTAARVLMERFVEETARHFADNSSVLAIDVWNEPHLEPMFDYKDELLCYCPHSCNEFRTWLRHRYSDLDGLNRAWFRQYLSWEEVVPPPRFGTWTDMIDWRLFWIENLRRWLRIRVDAARRGAPGKIVQTHVAYSGVLGNGLKGGLSNELGDEFSLAREVDVFGLSSFPKWLQGPDHMYVHLIHNEMIAEASREKPFYQVELQGGAGKAGLLGGEVPDANDITVWNYNTIVAGGKGVLYWQYAPEPAGLESPGFGLTGFMGEDTARAAAAGICAKRLTTNAIATSYKVQPVNAIYVSRHSEVLCFSSERREHLYAASVDGIYRAAYNSGIPVRFFHEDRIDSLLEEDIAVMYLPMALALSPREIEVLSLFVEQGGTLIGEAGCGLYGPDGKLDLPTLALQQLFGLDHREIQALPHWGTVTVPPTAPSVKGFLGAQYRHLTTAKPGTEIVARFSDGYPAMTVCGRGNGTSVFLATCASLGYHEHVDEDTRALLVRYFSKSGYPQLQTLHSNGPNVVVRLLENADSYLVAAVNHGSVAGEVMLEFIPGLVEQDKVEFSVEGYSGEVVTVAKNGSR